MNAIGGVDNIKSAGRIEQKGAAKRQANMKSTQIAALHSIDQNYSYKADGGLIDDSQSIPKPQLNKFKSNIRSEMNSIQHPQSSLTPQKANSVSNQGKKPHLNQEQFNLDNDGVS